MTSFSPAVTSEAEIPADPLVYVRELERYVFDHAWEKPGFVHIAIFLDRTRKKLEGLRLLKNSLNLQPRRRIEKAREMIGMSHSSMYDLLKKSGLTADAFCVAANHKVVIENGAAILRNVRQLAAYHRHYILGEPLEVIDEPTDAKSDL
ncbi:hypothetical protein A2881_03835 [Candidatus Peribacteria bacterium RIFCSPHIGHO2_01_FULL_55_13]|nr:MAG: hypothetical protein A2881_03835 [Candidatus Peribacteria bacterium RIFCSPHIGHO2_01_FULL_55_13]OGJ65868.1 MAG: hypothetical protein A3F36_04515 [Candidatus Peribacteria bacterium RIFCSPHIGHO2_12_FULL_55_11]